LDSTPQLFAGERHAVGQGAQLGPGDLRMDGAAQAAVGAGDDVFLADESKTVMNGQKELRSFCAGLHGYLQSCIC